MPPQFLVIGHTVQDLSPGQGGDAPAWRLGGTVAYAALLAGRLGLSTSALTAAADDLPIEEALPDVEVARVPSEHSTQIRNVYGPGGRVQHILRRAAPITADSLPQAWRGEYNDQSKTRRKHGQRDGRGQKAAADRSQQSRGLSGQARSGGAGQGADAAAAAS